MMLAHYLIVSFFYKTLNNLIVHHDCSAKEVCRGKSFGLFLHMLKNHTHK